MNDACIYSVAPKVLCFVASVFHTGRYEAELSSTRTALDDANKQIVLVRTSIAASAFSCSVPNLRVLRSCRLCLLILYVESSFFRLPFCVLEFLFQVEQRTVVLYA